MSLGLRAVWMLAAMLAIGCGYTTRGLYPEGVRTVAVPIFETDGLRRGYEFQLTERVIQEIETKTTFKVVHETEADTVLRGRIVNLYKSPFGEDGFDNPRGGAMVLNVSVTWTDNRSGEVINTADRTFTLQTMEQYTINLAESQATAMDRAIAQMADHIVTLMQSPW